MPIPRRRKTTLRTRSWPRWLGCAATDRVLDVACGPGFLTRAFALRCAEAVGVDATDALLDIAPRNALEHGVDERSFRIGRRH